MNTPAPQPARIPILWTWREDNPHFSARYINWKDYVKLAGPHAPITKAACEVTPRFKPIIEAAEQDNRLSPQLI